MRLTWAWVLLFFTLACAARGDDGFVHVLGEDGATVLEGRPLHLVAERRLRDLLDDADCRLEASGVVARDDSLFVVFDDTTDVARVRDDLAEAEWIETEGGGGGYEGIAWSPEERRFHCVVEAVERAGEYRARVATFDEDFGLLDEAWLKLDLPGENKGVEGLAVVHRDGVPHVLALLEGHPDDAANDGAVRGRIEVFRQKRDGDGWKHVTTLKLPRAVRFADWSGLDVVGDRVAAVSQQSSALWIGRLAPDDWAFVGDGETYLFPRRADGAPRYATVEGVTFLGAGRVAVVTDMSKDGAAPRDRGIHVFALRAGAE